MRVYCNQFHNPKNIIVGYVSVLFLFSLQFRFLKAFILFLICLSVYIAYQTTHLYFFRSAIQEFQKSQLDFYQSCDSVLCQSTPPLNEECIICFLDLEPAQQIVSISCPCKNYFYHKTCIQSWFKNHSTCPVCRIDLRSKMNLLRMQIHV